MSLRFFLLIVPLLLAPPLGLWLAGRPLHGYFEFPPVIAHLPPPSGLTGWWLLMALLALWLLAMAYTGLGHWRATEKETRRYPWPRWGRYALLLPMGLLLAPWLPAGPAAALALAGVTVAAGALNLRLHGRALLQDQPGMMLQMGVAGALLWWLMEYLNRFVESWLPQGIASDAAGAYLLASALPALFIAPAILSLRQLLGSHPGLAGLLRGRRPLPLPQDEKAAVWGFALALLGLFGGALWPSGLYPLLWLAPLLLIAAIGETGVGAGPRHGDWGRLLIPAFSGALCGGLWLLVDGSFSVALALPDCCPATAAWLVSLLGFGLFGILCLQLVDLTAAGWRKRSGRTLPRGHKKGLDIPIKVE